MQKSRVHKHLNTKTQKFITQAHPNSYENHEVIQNLINTLENKNLQTRLIHQETKNVPSPYRSKEKNPNTSLHISIQEAPRTIITHLETTNPSIIF